MIKKIVYLFYTHVYDFEYEKYGLNLMKEKGIEVEAWSLEKLYFPNLSLEQGCTVNGIETIYFAKWWSVFERIMRQKRKETMFIFQLPVHSKQTSICQVLVKACGYKYCMLYSQPYLSENTIGRLKYSRLVHIWWEDMINRVFSASYNFLATKTNFLDFSSRAMIQRKNNVLIHTLDYDQYLNCNGIRRLVDEKYILFLDEYEPFHPEKEMLGLINSNQNAEKYYKELNCLFSIIEKKTGYKVVIAEHPRAHYEDKEEFLYGREHYRNETVRLVRDCEWVITHCSIAQDYVVLYDKPFLIIYDDNIKNSEVWYRVYNPYQKMFDCAALKIDEPYSWDDIKTKISHNKEDYDEFYHRYIRSGKSKQKLFFQIVYDIIVEGKKIGDE